MKTPPYVGLSWRLNQVLVIFRRLRAAVRIVVGPQSFAACGVTCLDAASETEAASQVSSKFLEDKW